MSEPLSFRPVRQILNLAGHLTQTLQAQIEGGELVPGQKLPTEQEIVASTGVSRTVVREALASLRARGLIYTRQGLGAFVSEPAVPPASFQLTQQVPDGDPFAEILRVLELRLSIEVEAAGLAAQRRTSADLAALRGSLEALDAGGSGDGAEQDFAFHRAVLAATGNPYFAEIFDVLGGIIIPRQRLRLGDMAAAERERYLRGLAKEHRAIFSAIESCEVGAAQRAMRSHLGRALDRYRALAEGAGSSREPEGAAERLPGDGR